MLNSIGSLAVVGLNGLNINVFPNEYRYPVIPEKLPSLERFYEPSIEIPVQPYLPVNPINSTEPSLNIKKNIRLDEEYIESPVFHLKLDLPPDLTLFHEVKPGASEGRTLLSVRDFQGKDSNLLPNLIPYPTEEVPFNPIVNSELPPLDSKVLLPAIPKEERFIAPAKGEITSGYGWRWGRLHAGIDIAAPIGTPVIASKSGKVVYSGWADGYGNLVEIEHKDSYSTLYAHNETLLVQEGQQVVQGQLIAYMGSTGFSTGPHTHFEVHKGGYAVNPAYYLGAQFAIAPSPDTHTFIGNSSRSNNTSSTPSIDLKANVFLPLNNQHTRQVVNVKPSKSIEISFSGKSTYLP